MLTIKDFIGTREFYRRVIILAVPIMIQNGITNFVNLLDNIMVGQVGMEQVSGIGIDNQLIYIFNLCIFGAISGPGLFGAQFFGKKDYEGVKSTFRFKIIICGIIGVLGITIAVFFSDGLIGLYLHESDTTGDVALTMLSAKNYMMIMAIGFIPFSIMQVYTSTLREGGETMLPMKASAIAVLVNVVLNYILIFGKFGVPALGVVGAAIATVIARWIECGIVVLWTHKHKEINHFIVGVYSSMHIPKPLAKKIMIIGAPLLLNETIWSMGLALVTQSYSVRGLAVVAALSICSTVINLCNVLFKGVGSSVAIIVGQLLGANRFDEAKTTAWKMIGFSVICGVIAATIMAVIAPFFPEIYNTTEIVKWYATSFILISAAIMPVSAFAFASYFTIRSGGKTLITFMFDSGFVWVMSLPAAFILSRFTGLPIILVYGICQCLEIIKCIIAFTLIKKGIWVHNIARNEEL